MRRWLVVGLFAVWMVWSVRSGPLRNVSSLAIPGLNVAAYQPPTKGPVADVHPEVLNLQTSFANVAKLVKPAVVSISTVRIERSAPQFFFGDPLEQFFGGQDEDAEPAPHRRGRGRGYRMEGVGSGVIIDPTGLVLTNDHVVNEADEIKVLVYDENGDKKEYKATVVGRDGRTDIAVVRIHAGHPLPFASLGDSDLVKVGDWAIAIGSPFALAQTVTVGVISAARQSLAIEDREYHNLIQTDAAINRGNSGGPLLNIRGEVVGINTAIYAPTGVFAGIGFAVPINQAKAILDDLVSRGKVVRGWLGVELRPEITPAIVSAFGLTDGKGALVNEVLRDSPAAKAGLVRGDVIRTYDGKPVTSSADLQNKVANTSPKKAIRLEVIRHRKTVPLTLVIGERPESADNGGHENPNANGSEEKGSPQTWLGAHVVPLTSDLADNFRQPPDTAGVIVTDVDPGSEAEDMGLLAGDVVLAVNQSPTPTPEAFKKATANINLSKGAVLDVLRQGHPIYLSYSKG